jgi:hypothetical protein
MRRLRAGCIGRLWSCGPDFDRSPVLSDALWRRSRQSGQDPCPLACSRPAAGAGPRGWFQGAKASLPVQRRLAVRLPRTPGKRHSLGEAPLGLIDGRQPFGGGLREGMLLGQSARGCFQRPPVKALRVLEAALGLVNGGQARQRRKRGGSLAPSGLSRSARQLVRSASALAYGIPASGAGS